MAPVSLTTMNMQFGYADTVAKIVVAHPDYAYLLSLDGIDISADAV